MKKMRVGRMTNVPISNPRRLKQRHRPLFVLKSVLIGAIVIGLGLSAVLTLQMGSTADVVALGSSDLPAESGRIDASGIESVFEESIIDPRLILGTELPVIYGLDLDEVEIEETEHEPQPQPGTDIFFDVLPEDIKMEILGFANDTPKDFHIGTQGPQIWIYHTHTLEAYRQIAGQEYVEAGSWRTEDEDSSVVAVGEMLKAELESYGYTVLHDMTNHEPPSLKTAYSRSLETMEKYAKEYPTLQVYIDVHRDAYNDVEAGSKDFVTVDGNECARMMFVVGTGEKYDVKPNYESNYKLALAVTNELESICKGFTRPIRVKTGRYNQQVSDMCLLIEMGHNANALEQAKNAAKYAALALSRVVAIGE
jgi:stage II sporulation protein P